MTQTVIVPLDGSDFALRALPVATVVARVVRCRSSCS